MTDHEAAAPLLSIQDLRVRYGAGKEVVKALDGVSLDLAAGRSLGLVGETGSGKSTVAHATLDLLGPTAHIEGGIVFAGTDLRDLSHDAVRRVRGSAIALIPQAAINGLNPVVKVGRQVAEALRVHGVKDRADVKARVAEAFDRVELPLDRINAFPHELSGGMRQRVAIAMALVGRPRLVVADEPTTALDVVVQEQILGTIKRLQAELGFALLLISHDLGVIADICDEVAVMREGRIVEHGTAAQVFTDPQDPYSQELKRAATGVRPARSKPAPGEETAPFLVLDEVHKHFAHYDSALARLASSSARTIKAVDGVSLEVRRGEVLAIVGQSGSGKSTIANLALGLDKPSAGTVLLDGRPITELTRFERTSRVQMVFQDPFRSLDPRVRVFDALAEPLRAHGWRDQARITERVEDLLTSVRLSPSTRYAERFPHELSGGQRQRVVIARAIALRPALVVADEPVSMLDVSVQAGVLDVMTTMRDELDIGFILITHDLRVAEYLADRIAVIYQGRIVEVGTAEAVLTQPRHAYTRLLLDSIPGRRNASEWGA